MGPRKKNELAQSRPLRFRLAALAAAAAALAIAVCGGRLARRPDLEALHPLRQAFSPPLIRHPTVAVPRFRWNPSRPFAEELASAGTPVVLTHAAPDLWRARDALNSAAKVAARLREANDTRYDGAHDEIGSGESSGGGGGGGARLEGVFHHGPGKGATFGPFFDGGRPFAALASVAPRNPYDAAAVLSADDFEIVFSGGGGGSEDEGGRLGGAWAYSGALADALGPEAEDQ